MTKLNTIQSIDPVESLSPNDLRLKKYLELDSAIKVLTKELEQIKDEIKHQGSYSTRNYVVIVEDRTRTSPPGLETLIKAYGESVKALCKETVYKIVKVSEKAGI